MLASIRVSDYVNPERGSRPWNAVEKAIAVKPDVRKIGESENEMYFRVQCPNRDRRCVIIWYDSDRDETLAQCTCEAFYIPHVPTHCLHIAAVVIWESNIDDARPKPRKSAAAATKRRRPRAKQK